MITELFSVFDLAAQRYMDPICAPTMEFAIRGFRECCEKVGHQFQKYPEDYVMYHVGSFDGETGEMGSVVLTKVAMAISYAVKATPEPSELRLAQEGMNDSIKRGEMS